jgi:rfaE bifunctional protein kinase chain/domain
LTRARLEDLIDRIRRARIGVVGDFCIDAYWQLDTGEREISLETGKPTHGVRSQRYAPGGGGNVAANLAALGTGTVLAFGVIGPDLFGREVALLLHQRGIDTSGLLVQEHSWETPVYAKPYTGETEEERIDFGRWNVMQSERPLGACILSALPRLDCLVVNQQLSGGVHTDAMIRLLNESARQYARVPFIVDARTVSDSFTGMITKLNAKEAARRSTWREEAGNSLPIERIRSSTREIGARTGKPVFVTRSAEGILLYDGKGFRDLPALPLAGPVDPVGAGDATVAAIAAALASGATLAEAGELGNIVACVTVQKLKETGTATPAEVLTAWELTKTS